MIHQSIIDIVEIFLISFLIVLAAVHILPKEKSSKIAQLTPRAAKPRHSYKKVSKAS